NLAARLQTLAEPGTVLLSEEAHRLVDGQVESRFGGSHEVKGKSEPQKVYHLDAVRARASRFDASMSRGLGSYVGRDSDLETLQRCLAAAGIGMQLVDIVGEAGVGKSRLVHEFRLQLGGDGASVLFGACSADGAGTPFLPFIEVVRAAFGLGAGDLE